MRVDALDSMTFKGSNEVTPWHKLLFICGRKFHILVNYSATAKYLCYLCLRKALETGMHERGWGMIADEATKLFAVNLKKQFTILYYVS